MTRPAPTTLSFARLAFACAALALGCPSPAQNTSRNVIAVDASTPIAAPETGYLNLGGTSSTGHSLTINSRYLVLDGKPWLPVMGEFHFTRYPEAQWEDEILKMKSAGINIISTYVFWIHHEEIQGSFDWEGRRDLRRFVQLCAKHQMYVWLRIGPWDHGEVRNGGFPDWLMQMPNLRSNDPTYLKYAGRFYTQIGEQVHGLLFEDGGPIIGTQIENEYGLHGPGRGAEHILKLKQLAIAAGLRTPIYSVTGWPSLDFPPHEVVPVSGGYPDGFWYGSQTTLPPSMTYLFNFHRELGDMGATVSSEDPTGKVDLNHDPFFAAEEAGGMASAYHRRPVLSADDIAALTLTGIGSGINLYGYYMFHGGANPDGFRSTLQESTATGYPNDLPEIGYDFVAPLGEAGEERDSFRKTRLLHLFLNAFGSQLAPMPAFAPAKRTRDPADTSTPRVAVRTDGAAGFIFVNNYVRQLAMPARDGFQVLVKLASATIAVPATPVTVPANTYFAWPFHLALGHAMLDYSTAQLVTRIQRPNGKLFLFFAVPGIAPEFRFEAGSVHSLSATSGRIVDAHGTIAVEGLQPGLNSTISFQDPDGQQITLLVLTEPQAENVSLLSLTDGDHLAISDSVVFADDDTLHLRSSTSATQTILLLPDAQLDRGRAESDGLWTSHTFTQPPKFPRLEVTETQAATPRESMTMGPYIEWRKKSVAAVPPESAFANAAVWRLGVSHMDMSGLSDLRLKITYTADIARLMRGNDLLDDTFFNGLPWSIDLKRLQPEDDRLTLDLRLLAMPHDPPIYLEPSARAALNAAGPQPQLLNVQLIPEYETVTRHTTR